MKVLAIVSILLGSLVSSFQQPEKYQLVVTIDGIRNENGFIGVALHDGDSDFPEDDPFMSEYVDAEDGSVEVIFENVPEGEYAIAVMHDENGNEEVDMTEYGIPLEGFGFSNDAMGNQGPPDFSDASFEVTGDGSISINIMYLN